ADPEIAGQRNTHTRTRRNAIHDCNGGLPQLVDVGSETTNPTEVVEPHILRWRFRCLRPRPGKICPRTKSPTPAGKDRNPDIVIFMDAITRRMDLVPQRPV